MAKTSSRLLGLCLLLGTVVGLPHLTEKQVGRDLEEALKLEAQDDHSSLEEQPGVIRETGLTRCSKLAVTGFCLTSDEYISMRPVKTLSEIKGATECPRGYKCATGITLDNIRARNAKIRANEDADREREENAVTSMFPSGKSYSVWLERAIKALIGTGKVNGRKKAARKLIHEITFVPGHATFATKGHATCSLYASERHSYASPADRDATPDECDIKGMRYADMCASDNPVKPLLTNSDPPAIYTLWESRHDDNMRSWLFCPKIIKERGTARTRRHLVELGNSPRGYRIRYGGETEVKRMKIEAYSSTGAKILCYGKYFFRVWTMGGQEVLRVEGENASGIKDDVCWAEVVTAPLPLDGDMEGDKSAEEIISDVYAKLKALGSGGKTGPEIRLSGYRVELLNDNFQISGLDKLDEGICQGNYQVPLTAVATDLMEDGFTKKGKIFAGAVKYATDLVSRLVELYPSIDDADQLRGLFTIYLYNMYWFARIDTKADTAKDLWDHVPKTPVVDIIRALTDGNKRALKQWVTNQDEESQDDEEGSDNEEVNSNDED